jgi:hypothetical protein
MRATKVTEAMLCNEQQNVICNAIKTQFTHKKLHEAILGATEKQVCVLSVERNFIYCPFVLDEHAI